MEADVHEFRDRLACERDLWTRGFRHVAGVDEAGRGPLAGPVVAAAVVFRTNQGSLPGVRDSKKLTPAQREALLPLIHHNAISVSVAAVSEADIDRTVEAVGTALEVAHA